MGFLDELENLSEQDTMGKIPGKPNRPITSSKELAKVTEKQVEDLEEHPRKGELGNEEVIESNFNEDTILIAVNEALVLIDEAEEILNEKFLGGLREKQAKRKLEKAEKRLNDMQEDERVYRSLKLGDKEMATAKKRIKKAEDKLAAAKSKYESLKSESQDTIGKIPGELKEIKSVKELEKVPTYQKEDIKTKEVKGELGNEEVIEGEKMTESAKQLYAEAMEIVDEIDELLDEAEDLLSESGVDTEKLEKSIRKAERKLEKAKTTRKEMDNINIKVQGGLFGSGLVARTSAASVRRDKARQDNRIEKLERKLKELRIELNDNGKKSESYIDLDQPLSEAAIEELINEAMEISEEIDNLLDEAEDLLSEEKDPEKALRKAERKLEKAKITRKEMDNIKTNVQGGLFGSGLVARTSAASIRRDKARQDKRIRKLEAKVKALKSEDATISEQNTVGVIPGKPMGPVTSSKELAKVPELQHVEELQPKFDQAPKGGKPIVNKVVEDDYVEKEIVEDERELGLEESVTVDNIRVYTREQGQYFISESAFEACCQTYPKNTQLDVLYAIAESYDIDVDDIFFLEGEDTAKKRVRAKIDRLKKQLKDTAPSSETAKDLRKRIKQLKAKL